MGDYRNNSCKVVRYLPSKEGIVGDSRNDSCEVVRYLPSKKVLWVIPGMTHVK